MTKYKVGDKVRYIGKSGPECMESLSGVLVIKRIGMPPGYANTVPLYDFDKCFAAMEYDLVPA